MTVLFNSEENSVKVYFVSVLIRGLGMLLNLKWEYNCFPIIYFDKGGLHTKDLRCDT